MNGSRKKYDMKKEQSVNITGERYSVVLINSLIGILLIHN